MSNDLERTSTSNAEQTATRLRQAVLGHRFLPGTKPSGHSHVDLARIAEQSTFGAFIRLLVSRPSLVIALFWRRRNAMCENQAHHALVEAMRSHDDDAAEEQMKGHLLDLVSQLDLRDHGSEMPSLREALAR